MDSRIKKWDKWLDSIEKDLVNLVLAKNTFWAVQDMINGNSDIPGKSSFYRYLGDTYVSHVLSGIRRQVKFDKQSISFARLLKEISEDPTRVSRKFHRSLYRGSMVEDLADSTFDQYCDKPGAVYISSGKVRKDLKGLKRVASKCEGYADRRIAHHDKRQPEAFPRFVDMNRSLERLDKLYVKYQLLFRAVSQSTVMPVYQYDWMEVFDVPWRSTGAEI